MVSDHLGDEGLKSFETELADSAALLVLETLERVARTRQLPAHRLGSDCIAIANTQLLIRTGPDPLRPGALTIGIEKLFSAEEKQRNSTVNLNGNGQYSKLRICAPVDCLGIDEVVQAVSEFVESSYRKRVQDVLAASARNEARTAAPAYSAIRGRFPQRLAGQIWLYQVEGNKGRYLLDTEARLALMATLSAKRSSARIRSALALYQSFAGRILPIHSSYSGTLLRDNRSMVCSLITAPYAEGCFELAEQVVMGGNAMFGQPLVTEGHIRLLAGYDPAIKDEVESALSGLAPELAAICSTSWFSRLRGTATRGRLAGANEILELKPNAFGIGLNLNALIARHMARH